MERRDKRSTKDSSIYNKMALHYIAPHNNSEIENRDSATNYLLVNNI